MSTFYAHSTDGPPEEWQPLEEHLKNDAQLGGMIFYGSVGHLAEMFFLHMERNEE
jgi:hypothetical protein